MPGGIVPHPSRQAPDARRLQKGASWPHLDEVAAKDQVLIKLGRNLRKAREKRGWSQEEMAFQCGVHRTYAGSVERGEYNITVLTLRKFTKALRISLRDALRGIS